MKCWDGAERFEISTEKGVFQKYGVLCLEELRDCVKTMLVCISSVEKRERLEKRNYICISTDDLYCHDILWEAVIKIGKMLVTEAKTTPTLKGKSCFGMRDFAGWKNVRESEMPRGEKLCNSWVLNPPFSTPMWNGAAVEKNPNFRMNANAFEKHPLFQTHTVLA